MEQILKDFLDKDEAMDAYIDSKTIYLSKEDVDILLKRQKRQLKLCGVGRSKRIGYMIVNKNGNPITTDCKLPIYWLKKTAIKEASKFGADIVKIQV